MIDRTPRACTHKIARHEHGTHTAYKLDRCRCPACVTANTVYERTRTRQVAYGRWQPYVDAEPARQHVLALRAAGVGLKAVVARGGVPSGTLTKLMYGAPGGRPPSRRIRHETAERILAVQADAVRADHALVDATRTARSIEGLVALGYPKAWVARQLGAQSRALQVAAGGQVLAETERAVLALAERVGDRPGPSVRARRYAAARGWLTPAQQYAASLGELDNEPLVDEVAVERALAGEPVPLTRLERIEVARRSLARGHGPSMVAKTLHTNGSEARRLVEQARRPA